MQQKYEKLVEKNPIARSEFAKSNLGKQGCENLTTCDLENYFPGTMHLSIRSVESLSIQIGMCAIGGFVYLKVFCIRQIAFMQVFRKAIVNPCVILYILFRSKHGFVVKDYSPRESHIGAIK